MLSILSNSSPHKYDEYVYLYISIKLFLVKIFFGKNKLLCKKRNAFLTVKGFVQKAEQVNYSILISYMFYHFAVNLTCGVQPQVCYYFVIPVLINERTNVNLRSPNIALNVF